MGSRRWLGRALTLTLGLTAGWFAARKTDALGSTSAPTSWVTAPVERRDIGATVLATGVVRARVGAQVAVGSRASGVLQKLHVTVGDRVQAGQLLAELDQVELQTQVERAEASLVNATAERVYAEGELNRNEELLQYQGATQAELAGWRRAAATARAKEREANAAVDAAKVQLGFTSIRAPISGVVGSVSTQEGETVAASFAAPTFVTIVDLSRLEVWAYVDETDIGRVKVGQQASFTVDTWPDEAFSGRVTAIRPVAEIRDNVVNYITVIEIQNRPDRVLRPEMTATVNIVMQGRTGAMSVPNGALRRDAGGTYLLVQSGGGADRRAITVGFRGSEFTEVVSGVREGERVVLGPARGCESGPESEERK